MEIDHDVKPILQAILMADHVYRDANTGKHVIAGVFHDLFFIKAEHVQEQLRQQSLEELKVVGGMQVGSPYAYFSLTGVRGNPTFSLRYVSLEEDQVIFYTDIPIVCDDPLKTVEWIAALPPLPTEKAGIFALELLWNNEPLGSFRVTVTQVEPGDTTNGTD